MKRNLKINVIGLGYIGLPTAAILGRNGYDVFGIDTNLEIVENINNSQFSNLEPGLDDALLESISNGNLQASSEHRSADVHIVCVPTPLIKDEKNPTPDLSYVFDAAKSLAPHIKKGDLLIIESTITVGTTEEVRMALQRLGVDTNKIHIAHCPERVIPGKIMKELIQNDRIIGGLTGDATDRAEEFYKTFVTGNIVKTDARTAELCKLTENSFRDVNIAFANELSIICDKENINVWELIELANRHPRVNILLPSAGVGGHCIAVDPWFIVSKNQNESEMIQTARRVNLSKTAWVLKKINTLLESEPIEDKSKIKIGCLGITFKPDVDDIRESPALKIVNKLLSSGKDVMVVDPNVKKEMPFEMFDLKTVLRDADILVFLVKHKEFVELNESPKIFEKTVLDFCGALTKF